MGPMQAYFTVEDVAVLHGVRRKAARGLFDDRGGPYPRIPGSRVRTTARSVLDRLQLTHEEAHQILTQEQAA